GAGKIGTAEPRCPFLPLAWSGTPPQVAISWPATRDQPWSNRSNRWFRRELEAQPAVAVTPPRYHDRTYIPIGGEVVALVATLGEARADAPMFDLGAWLVERRGLIDGSEAAWLDVLAEF